MEVRVKIALLLTALTFVLVLLPAPSKAGAAELCASTPKPQLSWETGNIRWNSFQDYLDRRLTVDMLFRASGSNAYGVSIIGAFNSENVILSSPVPFSLGDLNAGGWVWTAIKYSVPAGVSKYRTSLYVTARDTCGNDHFYPKPLDDVAGYSMNATDNGRGQVTVKVNWEAGSDNDRDAVATVMYRLYPSNWWDSGEPEYTVAGGLTHENASSEMTIPSLLPGRYYDFTVEVSDGDGVEGEQSKTDAAKLLRDDRFTQTNILNNPHPGLFDEVRVRDFYNNSLYWYSSQSFWQYGPGYEFLLSSGVNHEYSVIAGKTAWKSVTDRPNHRIYIAGEMPRGDGGSGYRAMVGVINQNASPPALSPFLLPYTDDCNELIGITLDTAGNRILTGERKVGTPLRDSAWPDGGGLWSIQLDSFGNPSRYVRIWQDPLNQTWDKMAIFNGRLYVILSGRLISAALTDIPTNSTMKSDAWRTEIVSDCYTMIVSPYHGVVVSQGGNGDYLRLHVNDGSGWISTDLNQVFPGEGLYELPDHRFLVTRDNDGGSHHVGVASVSGEWEYLGVYPGGWPSDGYAVDGGNIYYGTVTPGKVWKVAYTP